MDLQNEFERLTESNEQAKYQFILTELDLALTFFNISDSSENEAKSKRNADHAKRAYSSAMHFMDGATLTSAMHDEIKERVARLEPMIQKLDGKR